MNDALVWLFKTLDAFVKVNVRADWESLHEDYAFVLESTSPSVAALALDRVRADAYQPLVASAPVEDDSGVVGAAGGRVAEVVEVEVVVPKVPVAPRPKPGGSKSVPSEWNKLAREKKEAERKLVVEREEAEQKGMAEEEEVKEMMDWPLEGKGKGVVREAVGSPEVATHGSAQRHIKSATFVIDSNEDDEEVPAAEPVPRTTPAASPSKGRKVEVMLPALRVTIGWVKGTTVSPFTERFLLSALEEVIDDLLVEMRGAGEITERYRVWLVANTQPGDIVSFWLGLVFIADGLCF
jgi:hypothetical protein